MNPPSNKDALYLKLRMNWYNQQTPINISGTVFPKFKNEEGRPSQRFWYIKDEFIRHSQELLEEGKMFSFIDAHFINERWQCGYQSITAKDKAYFITKLRLFYLRSESMSIHSFCLYMEKNIQKKRVQRFFEHMRVSWERHLQDDVDLPCDDMESIKTNKQLIDTLLYSGSFHSQEKYKKRYDELLLYMDESLIIKHTYNAFYCGYQMTQICTAIKELREDNLVIMLPNHLSHVWDENCPYNVV